MGYLKNLCNILDLKATERYRKRLEDAFQESNADKVKRSDIQQLFDRLRLQMEDDLRDTPFFYVRPSDAANFLKPTEPRDHDVEHKARMRRRRETYLR